MATGRALGRRVVGRVARSDDVHGGSEEGSQRREARGQDAAPGFYDSPDCGFRERQPGSGREDQTQDRGYAAQCPQR